MKEKLLLFDVDGVIVDSFDVIYPEIRDFLIKHGADEISKDDLKKICEGHAIEGIFSRIPNKKGSSLLVEEIRDYMQIYDRTSIFSGMKELIEQLGENHTLVVVTSSLIDSVTKKFEKEQILQYFSGFLGPRASLRKNKKIQMAMEEFGFDPQDVIFITDTSGDILEAKKAGIKTIAVTWGYHDRETLEKVNPDSIVDSPQELLSTIR